MAGLPGVHAQMVPMMPCQFQGP